MSGIVGVWNLDGRPLDSAVLSSMSASISHRGSDGDGQHINGPVGFACNQRWVTVEEIGERQPLVGRGGVVLMMDGRLDGRDEWLPRLRVPRSVSDATLALAAYEVWQDAFVERLNGDFAIAVFDESRQRLFLVRDSIGMRPLYYFRSDRLFAFASEIKALLAHPDIPPRPDDEGIADYMLTCARPLDRQDITCFAGISALPPAHVAVSTATHTLTRRYWDFDTGRTIRLGSPNEYAEAFRERFAEAVRRRIRSAYPVAIAVSGGLDSSSIFCQAERWRRSGAPPCPAVVGISHPGASKSDADENKYVVDIEREYCAEIQRFAIEPLVGLTAGAAEQIRASEAPLIDYMWGRTRELHQRAGASGARVFLTGDWGDQVLFSSSYLVDLFHQFRWREIRRHRREYLRWFGAVESSALTRRFVLDLARHDMPRRLVPPLKWVRRRLLGVERPKPWFSHAFLWRGLRLANRPATLGEGFHSAQARSIYLEARSKYHVHVMEWHNKIGGQFGLDASVPFLDRELLAFLMAIPGEAQNPGGVPRGLLREAMKGVLPESVRTRRGKADFSYLVNGGVAQDLPIISEMLSSNSLGASLGYLDVARLAPAVARLSAGSLAGPDCESSWDLADLVGLEVWLRVFLDEPRGPVPSHVPHRSLG